MAEKTLNDKIMLALSKLRTRIFRNNTGTGWQGEPQWQGRHLLLRNARPIHAGLIKGSSDLIGWTVVEITPEMVGRKVAVFTAIESKFGGTTLKPEQAAFIKAVRTAGGFAGIAHSVPEAVEIVSQLSIE